MSLLQDKRLAVVGAGNMGLALMQGLIDSQSIAAERITISNRRFQRSQELAKQYGVTAKPSNLECVEGADIVMLSVKPQIMDRVLEEIRPVAPTALFLSVAAGVSTEHIESILGGRPRVVRTMPNTPALIGEGATAICGGQHTTDLDLRLAQEAFEKVGCVSLVDESHLDAVTGLSGSGPAYIFLIIEAFADAGVKVGLSREVAMKLGVQTIQGAARMLQQTNEHPGKLKDQVTSPGGTAIAGLHTLEEGGLRTTIINAVEAATRRAEELGKK